VAGLRPDPLRWGAYSAPPDPLAGLNEYHSMGRDKEGRDKGGRGDGKQRMDGGGGGRQD